MEQTDMNDWYGPDAATFGDRLSAAREASGMSQKQFAKRLGVKLSSLAGWENDLSEPRANRLSMMAGILNVSIVWLLTGEGEGVGAPDEELAITPEVNDLLVDIRDLKAQIGSTADRLGLLEKKLRLALKSGS